MNELTPYEKLGISEDASFEDVRDARDRLQRQSAGNDKQIETIEAAYDAILMDRLRARQEGKIKVPDRIRFPERSSTPTPSDVQTNSAATSPAWISGLNSWLAELIDLPTQAAFFTSLSVFSVLATASLVFPTLSASLWLPLSLIASIYLINLKQNKLGRAFLIAIAGFSVAVIVGLVLTQIPLFNAVGLAHPGIIFIMFIVIWLFTCFLH